MRIVLLILLNAPVEGFSWNACLVIPQLKSYALYHIYAYNASQKRGYVKFLSTNSLLTGSMSIMKVPLDRFSYPEASQKHKKHEELEMVVYTATDTFLK